METDKFAQYFLSETIGSFYNQLAVQYKNYISGYHQWTQRSNAQEYVLFKYNLGDRISMDETCLSQRELYAIITKKSAKEGKGALIAMIKGTKSSDVIS